MQRNDRQSTARATGSRWAGAAFWRAVRRRWRAIASRARAAPVVPQGKLTLAWHTNIASRWLDPQQHDGTASPDNFLMALHDGADQELPRRALRPSGARRTLRVRRGREERHVQAARGHQVPRRHAGHAGGRQVELRALSRRLGRGAARADRRASRSWTTAPSASTSRSRSSISRSCWAPPMSCGAGWVVPAKYYEQVGQDGFHAEADRRRPLQAGLAGAGREARVRGVRRLLPPGPRQAVHDGQRAGGGDARRDARARRGGHHLFRPGRADRPGEEQSRS